MTLYHFLMHIGCYQNPERDTTKRSVVFPGSLHINYHLRLEILKLRFWSLWQNTVWLQDLKKPQSNGFEIYCYVNSGF